MRWTWNWLELTYKTATDTQTQRMCLLLPGWTGEGRDRLGVGEWHVYITILKRDNQQGPSIKYKIKLEICQWKGKKEQIN